MTKRILNDANSRMGRIVFSSHWFDDQNQREAIEGSLAILELAQRECTERPIRADEIAPAVEFLGERGAKMHYHLEAFTKALKIVDQGQRSQDTQTALATIRQQCHPL